MKLIHLSDLHLGKRLNEFSLMEDQKFILERILEIIEKEAADGVILAGDLYDKPVPPAEAVLLFDDFLTKLSRIGTRVYLVSGNHDSAERIAFGAQLLGTEGVFISPVYDGTVRKETIKDEYGEADIYLLPFLRPAAVRRVLDKERAEEGVETDGGKISEEITTYQDAVSAVVSRLNLDQTKRNILIAHQFVTGAARCDSEELVVGGLDQVDYSVFDGFDYVALGHIHSPQWVGRETVRYCGTPLKYSFSEENQEKSVTVIELKEKGVIGIRTVLLEPLRQLRTVKGSYMEVTAQSFYGGTNTDDYIQMILTDEEDVPDAVQKLRIIYPNLMQLKYDNKRTRESRQVDGVENAEKKSELEIFEEFYELQNNQPMSEVQRDFMEELIRKLGDKISFA